MPTRDSVSLAEFVIARDRTLQHFGGIRIFLFFQLGAAQASQRSGVFGIAIENMSKILDGGIQIF